MSNEKKEDVPLKITSSATGEVIQTTVEGFGKMTKQLMEHRQVADIERGKIVELASNLLETHWDQIVDLANDDEKNEVSISIAAKLDRSTHPSRVNVKISFKRSFSDEASEFCEDPNQQKLDI